METKQAILSRKSTRHFTEQKIKQEDLIDIVKTAQQAPSWVNAQPEHVYIATGQTLENIRQKHQEALQANVSATSHLKTIPNSQWPELGQKNMNQWFEDIGQLVGDDWNDLFSFEQKELYNAQAIVYLTLPKNYSLWSLYDLGAFGEALMVTAQDKGIGSLPAYQFISYPDILRQELAITEDNDIIMGIGLGYRDEKARINNIRGRRMDTNKILTIKD